MIKMITKTLLLSIFAFSALADDRPFQWTGDSVRMVESGDPVNGEKLAKQHKCSKCHGDDGIAEDDESPSIAGQLRGYHYKQFMDYRSGVRDDKDMRKLAKKLSDQEIADLAAHFEKLLPEFPPRRNAPRMATRGDDTRLLISCNECHGEEGKGYGYETPRLWGQKVVYFTETMMAFKEGDRENDDYGRMRFIANRLTDQEIEDLAKYYSMPPMKEGD